MREARGRNPARLFRLSSVGCALYDRIDALTVKLLLEPIMQIEPIRTDAEHEAMLRSIEALWAAPHGTRDGNRLDALVATVVAYEDDRWPLDESAP